MATLGQENVHENLVHQLPLHSDPRKMKELKPAPSKKQDLDPHRQKLRDAIDADRKNPVHYKNYILYEFTRSNAKENMSSIAKTLLPLAHQATMECKGDKNDEELVNVWLLAITLCEITKQFDDASDYIKLMASSGIGNTMPKVHITRAHIQILSGHTDKAIHTLRKALVDPSMRSMDEIFSAQRMISTTASLIEAMSQYDFYLPALVNKKNDQSNTCNSQNTNQAEDTVESLSGLNRSSQLVFSSALNQSDQMDRSISSQKTPSRKPLQDLSQSRKKPLTDLNSSGNTTVFVSQADVSFGDQTTRIQDTVTFIPSNLQSKGESLLSDDIISINPRFAEASKKQSQARSFRKLGMLPNLRGGAVRVFEADDTIQAGDTINVTSIEPESTQTIKATTHVNYGTPRSNSSNSSGLSLSDSSTDIVTTKEKEEFATPKPTPGRRESKPTPSILTQSIYKQIPMSQERPTSENTFASSRTPLQGAEQRMERLSGTQSSHSNAPPMQIPHKPDQDRSTLSNDIDYSRPSLEHPKTPLVGTHQQEPVRKKRKQSPERVQPDQSNPKSFSVYEDRPPARAEVPVYQQQDPAAMPAKLAEKLREGSTKSTSEKIKVNGLDYYKFEQIGKGGSSKVYKAVGPDRSFCAIKKVKLRGDEATSTVQSYVNEITLLQRLRGKSNIIQLIDSEVNRRDGEITLVMECGEIDLALALRRAEGDVSCWKYVNMLRIYWQQMLEAVHTIHQEPYRIVHGDLKPANFLFVQGVLKLIDFGIAKAIQNGTTNIFRETSVGTLNYMSPESINITSEGTPIKDVLQRCLVRNPKERITMKELLNHDFLCPKSIIGPVLQLSVVSKLLDKISTSEVDLNAGKDTLVEALQKAISEGSEIDVDKILDNLPKLNRKIQKPALPFATDLSRLTLSEDLKSIQSTRHQGRQDKSGTQSMRPPTNTEQGNKLAETAGLCPFAPSELLKARKGLQHIEAPTQPKADVFSNSIQDKLRSAMLARRQHLEVDNTETIHQEDDWTIQ